MQNKYLTVSALNRYLKAKIESDVHLNQIYITGELSNVKYHSSGHCYFTLKDDKSRINAVMFQTQLRKVLFRLEDGMKVLAICRLSIYEPQGTYQLYVDKIDIDGLGNLYMAYEKRRLLLQKEGLFSQEHKKNIPLYPQNIGIITAATGAAIHDIVSTIKRLCPSAKMTLYPSLVQGEDAPLNLIRRLKEADQNQHDVLIIGRGGGSLEDLWAFNDEHLARAIYHASTPIISGVGHESDVTICDFVADLRAPTPTGAAQLACFNQSVFETTLKQYQNTLTQLIYKKIQVQQSKINQFKSLPIFRHPEKIYQTELQRMDDLYNALNNAIKTKVILKNHHIEVLSNQLMSKIELMQKSQNQFLDFNKNKLMTLMTYQLKHKKQTLISSISQLNAYNPLNVLERGYTLALQDEKVVTSKNNLDYSKPLIVSFKDGEVYTMIQGDQTYEKNDL